ncbi:hypothetical protein J8L98_13180 [Pseudoalteromonas sp. MMG013]|uniref:hypothetical protein n=1 Tax=Pseudoalteromonas sp. MMG013 TaxID=2822687 RepID=UPI001B39060D|nr:hypothetical protein [Pseudoalteromonas sp. MMG013]MBQ4862642.1 hypothetical protein [Pseudoalteromonas sp. MMG013]
MKLINQPYICDFDLSVYCLGYETRSVTAYEKYKILSKKNIVLGYNSNKDVLNYQSNKRFFSQAEIIETECSGIPNYLNPIINKLNEEVEEPKVLVDITVMTRHRLATVLFCLLNGLKKKSTLTMCYNASKYVSPPSELQPVRKVGALIHQLSGNLGDLSSSTAVIFGLGYEHLKALGVYNYLDPDLAYTFIPTSDNTQFEIDVRENNKSLIENIINKNIHTYNVYNPLDLYIDLKSLILSLKEGSRVVIVPLGPKILAAISLIISMEMDLEIPVWRVSSLHSEEPIDRVADREVLQTISL